MMKYIMLATVFIVFFNGLVVANDKSSKLFSNLDEINDYADSLRSKKIDASQFIKDLELKSNSGDLESTIILFGLYNRAVFVEADAIMASKYAERAIKLGYSPLYYYKALCFQHGKCGVKQDNQMAYNNFLKAANAGDSLSAMSLCVVLMLPEFYSSLDKNIQKHREKESLKWCRLVQKLDKKSEAEAVYYEAVIFDYNKESKMYNRDTACQLYSKSARLGDTYGMVETARCYKDGVFGEDKKYKYKDYLRKAKEAGHFFDKKDE